MTTDSAREVIEEALKKPEIQNDRMLFAALQMSIQALASWDKHQDIEYDYAGQAKMLKEMIIFHRQDEKPIKQDGVWLCPACHRRISEWHSYCHCCGKKVGWETVPKRKPRDWYKQGKGKKK